MTRYRSWVFGYVLFLAIATLGHGLVALASPDGWRMGDWLISYHAGFVRRGLTGELALDAARLLHLHSPFGIVFAMQVCCYAVIFFTVDRLLRGTLLDYWTVLCVVSPATLAFQWIVPGGGFRKEVLLLAGLAGLIVLVSRPHASRPLLIVYLSVLGVVWALSHEGLVAFTPYLVAALAIGLDDLPEALRISALPALLTAIAAGFAVHASGNAATVQGVCSALGYANTDPLPPLCVGAIDHLALSFQQSHADVLRYMGAANYPTNYAVLAILALLAPAMQLVTMGRRGQNPDGLRVVVACALVAFAASVPLFYVAIDWGRWIYIHVFCLFLLVLQMEWMRQASGRAIARLESAPAPRETVGSEMPSPTPALPRKAAPIAIAFGFLYAAGWMLPYVGQLHWPWGYPLMLSLLLRH